MTSSNLDTAFHKKLSDLSESLAGFSASELTGYAPEQVRRAAEALVKAGRIVRFKVAPRRIRYFASEQAAQNYIASQSRVSQMKPAVISRTKARWKPEDPPVMTAKTKVYVAPPLPRDVLRTNTYQLY